MQRIKKSLILVMLMCAEACYSQSVLRIQHLNVEDGLSQSSVYSILQDSYGFIWMATGDGLNRFDGKEFVAYKSKLKDIRAGNLRDRNINSVVFEDCYHNFWFTADEGVYCMNRRSNSFEVHINRQLVGYAGQVIGVDSNMVWVPITGKGVYKIDAGTKTIRSYPFTDTFQSRGAVLPIVSGIAVRDGLWIVDAKGLIWFDKKTCRDRRVLLREGIRMVQPLPNGWLAMSVANGILLYDPAGGAGRFINVLVPGKEMVKLNSIATDTISGYMYVSDVDGGVICKMNMSTWKYELLHFQDNSIMRMYVDRSQNLWVGTDGGGVYKLDVKSPKFNCYIPEAGKGAGAMIKSLYRSDNGEIWMGLYGRGVLKYDPATGNEKLLTPVRKPEGVHFNCLFKDSAGDIVVGLNDRIAWMDERSGATRRECLLPYYDYMGGAQPAVFAIMEWRKGVYIAGANHGIFSVRNDGAKPSASLLRAFFNNTYGGWVYGFYRNDDNLYIGRRNGFSKARITNDSVPELLERGLPDMPIRHFYKSTTTPVVWLATEQGLVAYNELTDKYTVFDEDKGIANSFVYAILPQNDSVLWVSTNKGLSRVGVHYGGGSNITATFTNYTAKDGLQSNEFNSGAFFKCKDGTLMFGGIAGVNWFDPAKISKNPYKAQPAITGVYVDDTLMARDTAMYMKELVLPYDRNTISLTFKALEYTLPEQNRFAYKLEGLDRDWVYSATDRVRYPKLAPGEYRFLLKVSNNEGVWNEQPLELAIIITPPYWQTWWFRLLVFLGLTAIIVGITRYYTHQKVRAKTRELEKQHALNMERLRISKDVHDDIGSGLSRISLLSEMANRKIQDNQMPGKDIGNISSISKELVDNMRDLIWVLNPENTTLDNLVSRMREYCGDYLDGVGIASEMSFPEQVPAIHISREVQRNVFSTVKEAINNAVKHANATTIKITVAVDNDMLSIVIADNGDGFVINEARSGGNGLRNMRHRIELIGGQFDIVTGKGKGTEIRMGIAFGRLNSGEE